MHAAYSYSARYTVPTAMYGTTNRIGEEEKREEEKENEKSACCVASVASVARDMFMRACVRACRRGGEGTQTPTDDRPTPKP